MKVIASVRKIHKADRFRVKIGVVEKQFCCNTAREAWSAGFMGFGTWDTYWNNDANVNIYRTVCSPTATIEMAIKHCPFCGCPVEVELVEEPSDES